MLVIFRVIIIAKYMFLVVGLHRSLLGHFSHPHFWCDCNQFFDVSTINHLLCVCSVLETLPSRLLPPWSTFPPRPWRALDPWSDSRACNSPSLTSPLRAPTTPQSPLRAWASFTQAQVVGATVAAPAGSVGVRLERLDTGEEGPAGRDRILAAGITWWSRSATEGWTSSPFCKWRETFWPVGDKADYLNYIKAYLCICNSLPPLVHRDSITNIWNWHKSSFHKSQGKLFHIQCWYDFRDSCKGYHLLACCMCVPSHHTLLHSCIKIQGWVGCSTSGDLSLFS